jgi:hypothetical protein
MGAAFWGPAMSDSEKAWECEAPGCEERAETTYNCEFGGVDLCRKCLGVLVRAKSLPSWVSELFVPAGRRPRPLVALSADGQGLVVQGTVDSVELTLCDAMRLGHRRVAFLTDMGMVEVDASVDWELREVRRAER